MHVSIHANATTSTQRVLRLALIHPLHAWVDALEMLLTPQSDIEVVAANTTVSWVRHVVTSGAADLLLINIDDASVDGPGVIEALRKGRPDLAVVVMSDSTNAPLLAAAVRAGARGWVSQTASFSHLLSVINGVADGETWFPPELMTTVLESLLSSEQVRQQESELLGSLSSREIDVLSCLTRGLTRQQIADRFVLSPHTVRTHINNVLRKLDVHSTLAAVSIARKSGLADPKFD